MTSCLNRKTTEVVKSSASIGIMNIVTTLKKLSSEKDA